ncbi:hypothetical protein OTU49_000058 [Cherax quadricarinatus]|uniref:LicD/FKTN/FKRP nucleotidyltransferase domain-containing protein n=1 Tax=Cherax quadricarinatus TaxID=27406 RepID=A0AAW0Y1K4_CHEQU
MGRNASIQMFLLTLTGCSWMLLFLSVTLPDYHVFRVYHVAHVAAAHTPTPREADPCEVCWGVGKTCPQGQGEDQEHISSTTGDTSWGAHLAWALGVATRNKDKVSSAGGAEMQEVGGVAAFYYYTLHTTFTALRVKLKKAQEVAGDVQEEVATLGERVAHLQHTLTTHFSPRLNPYLHKPSITQPPGSNVNKRDQITSTQPRKQEEIEDSKSEIKNDASGSHRRNEESMLDARHENIRRVYPVEISEEASQRQQLVTANNKHEKLKNNNVDLSMSRYAQTLSANRAQLSQSGSRVRVDANTYTEETGHIHTPRISRTGNREKIQTIFSSGFRHQLSVNKTSDSSRQRTKFEEGREIWRKIMNEGKGGSSGPQWVVGMTQTSNEKSKGAAKLYSDLDRVGVRRLVSVVVMCDERDEVIASMGRSYPGMTVHLITRTPATPEVHQHLHLVVHSVEANTSTSVAYMEVLRHVTTPYLLVATGVSSLTPLARLERLVWTAEHLGVWAVGGGLETPSGHWHTGCLTSTYAHYQAGWARGQLGTADQCLICQGLEGPFLALTAALRHLGWDTKLPRQVSQVDLFLRASHTNHMLAAACPKSLFTLKEELGPPSRVALLSLARRHSLYTVDAAGAVRATFSCKEVGTSCADTGLALPPCCRQELATLVRFLMDTCEAHGLLCELQEGTLLGAVKTSGVMPWERDADITFHTKNFTALSELKDVFDRAGYSLYLTDNRWCCVDGRWAGGQGSLSSGQWRAELWSQHAMDSEDNLLAGRPRTRIEFDGSWVPAPTSPGQYVRNRYGVEVFRHAQHWLAPGRSSGWEEYEAGKFLPCPRPAHHACLDKYLPDGNLKLHPLCVT